MNEKASLLGEPFNVRLSDADKERLTELARENERTLAGEIRLAVRKYLEDHPRKGTR